MDLTLDDVPDGSIVMIAVRKDGVADGVLSMTLVEFETLAEIGTTEIDLATGESTGSFTSPDTVKVRAVMQAFEPGDLIMGNSDHRIYMVRSMSAQNLYWHGLVDQAGPAEPSSEFRRVGHVDLGELDLGDPPA